MHKLLAFFLILAAAVAASPVIKETAGLGPKALSTDAKDRLPSRTVEAVSNDGDENLEGAEFFHSGYRPVVRTYGYGPGYGYGGWGYGGSWYPRRYYW